MSDALAHIEAWRAAGLIDGDTADRLRAAEHAVLELSDHAAIDPQAQTPGAHVAPGSFGPGVSIPEVFGYLGGSFLLSAWFALITRTASSAINSELVLGIGSGIAAVVTAVLGAVLRSGDARRRRAAGVAFVVSVSAAGGAAGSLAGSAGLDWPVVAVIGSAAALALSIGLRSYHPAVLTQLGLLGALTSLAGALLSWFEQLIFPSREGFGFEAPPAGLDPLLLVIASAAWWLACAILIGLIGLRETRTTPVARDDAAARRAGLSRLWAGFTAVIGLATAIGRSDFGADGSYGRVLESWVGDLALMVLAVILIERAFRRDSASYIFAAALGLIVALSDFNFTYLSDSTESGLFIEGVILLGAGLAADRLRRRLDGRGQRPPMPTTAAGASVA